VITQLIYISRATQILSSSDLLLLLKQANVRNKNLSITGMLLYKDQSFMQLLEGPSDSVKQVFHSIKNDHRHKRITLISEKVVESRLFKGWGMGFTDIEREKLSLEGFVDYFSDPSSIKGLVERPSDALDLLTHFRMYN
jgi:hypothetical protein